MIPTLRFIYEDNNVSSCQLMPVDLRRSLFLQKAEEECFLAIELETLLLTHFGELDSVLFH